MDKIKEYTKKLIKEKECIHTSDFSVFPQLTPQDIYEIMSAEMNNPENDIVSVLETKCPHCGKWTGKYYEAFWCLPKLEVCPHCNGEFIDVVSENSYLVWCHKDDPIIREKRRSNADN